MSTLGIAITLALIDNVVLHQFLGLCAFIGVSRRLESAVGLGCAVVFATSTASVATWAIGRLILVPLGIEFLRTVTFVLVIVGLVGLAELAIRRVSPGLHRGLGIYLPLLSANCAVLGVALIAARARYGALESLAAGLAAGGGFLLAVVLMASLREKLDAEEVPKPFQGAPVALITAGLMALAFMAFDRAMLRGLPG